MNRGNTLQRTDAFTLADVSCPVPCAGGRVELIQPLTAGAPPVTASPAGSDNLATAQVQDENYLKWVRELKERLIDDLTHDHKVVRDAAAEMLLAWAKRLFDKWKKTGSKNASDALGILSENIKKASESDDMDEKGRAKQIMEAMKKHIEDYKKK